MYAINLITYDGVMPVVFWIALAIVLCCCSALHSRWEKATERVADLEEVIAEHERTKAKRGW